MGFQDNTPITTTERKITLETYRQSYRYWKSEEYQRTMRGFYAAVDIIFLFLFLFFYSITADYNKIFAAIILIINLPIITILIYTCLKGFPLPFQAGESQREYENSRFFSLPSRFIIYQDCLIVENSCEKYTLSDEMITVCCEAEGYFLFLSGITPHPFILMKDSVPPEELEKLTQYWKSSMGGRYFSERQDG